MKWSEILKRYYLQDEDKSIIRRDLNITSKNFDRVLYRAKKRVYQVLEKHKDIKALFFNRLSDGLHVQ